MIIFYMIVLHFSGKSTNILLIDNKKITCGKKHLSASVFFDVTTRFLYFKPYIRNISIHLLNILDIM